MESVENSPLALTIAQIILLLLQGILYTRGRNKNEGEKREREGLLRDLGMIRQAVDLAKREAETASSKADHVNRDLYETLRAKYEATLQDLAKAMSRINVLEESVKSLSNKLASRDRADKRLEKADPDPEADEPAHGEQLDIDELIRKHGQPLGGAGVAAPQPPQRSRPFGKPL